MVETTELALAFVKNGELYELIIGKRFYLRPSDRSLTMYMIKRKPPCKCMSTIYRHARHDADARVTPMQNGIVSRQNDPFVTPSHGTRNNNCI